MSGPSSSAGVSPMQIGVSRTEPTSSVPMRAVNDSASVVPAPFADAEGAARIAAGAEGALVQALDRLGVVRGFRQDGQGKFAHEAEPH